MIEVLKFFNYEVPNLNIGLDKNTNKFGPTGLNKIFEIKSVDNIYYYLYIKNQQWMMYDNNTHLQASQLFSHYYIARGNVITTGLGLAVRERWLLNNTKVKSLTILEKNKDLIEFHKEFNPYLFDKAQIINCDAKEYKGQCDILLLDHYEFENMSDIISDVKNICDNNIKCDNMWFWHLGTQIIADLHKVPEHNICDNFRQKKFIIEPKNLRYIKSVYENIKKYTGLNKLPNLTQEELELIITIYTNFFKIM